MIRSKQSHDSGYLHNQPVEAPSPEQIKQMTAEIRETWSPKTRAGRVAGGSRHVEVVIVSALGFGDYREPFRR